MWFYHAVKLALAQPGTGERHFTFEETKTNEKSKIEVSTENRRKMLQKRKQLYRSFLPSFRGRRTRAPSVAARSGPDGSSKSPQRRHLPAAPEKPTAAAQPRWKQSSVDADILDPLCYPAQPGRPAGKAC